MKLLILGGTADGRRMATSLHQQGVELIYSVAGLVRTPKVECQVVSGGFSQFGGLVEYIKQNQVTAILDVTHPYAAKMSATAAKAGVPYWRFHRPQWQPVCADTWHGFNDWDELLPQLSRYNNVLITVGQVSESVVNQLSKQQNYVLRTAVEPKFALPDNIQWIKAIGPFSLADETALLSQYNIDVLISKNSGGDATSAKLTAARQLNIPVYMQTRPALPQAQQLFENQQSCEQFILEQV